MVKSSSIRKRLSDVVPTEEINVPEIERGHYSVPEVEKEHVFPSNENNYKKDIALRLGRIEHYKNQIINLIDKINEERDSINKVVH